MTTYLDPTVYVTIWLMFGVPITILLVGVLVYFLKPKHRRANGNILVVLGSVELFTYLMLSARYLDLVPIILYTLSVLAIVVGVVSLKHTKIK